MSSENERVRLHFCPILIPPWLLFSSLTGGAMGFNPPVGMLTRLTRPCTFPARPSTPGPTLIVESKSMYRLCGFKPCSPGQTDGSSHSPPFFPHTTRPLTTSCYGSPPPAPSACVDCPVTATAAESTVPAMPVMDACLQQSLLSKPKYPPPHHANTYAHTHTHTYTHTPNNLPSRVKLLIKTYGLCSSFLGGLTGRGGCAGEAEGCATATHIADNARRTGERAMLP